MKISIFICLMCLLIVPIAFADSYGSGTSAGAISGSQAGAVAIGNVDIKSGNVPIGLPIIYPQPFVQTPSEFINDSKDGNYISIISMFPSGTVYTLDELVAMLTPVDLKWYQSLGVDANFHSLVKVQDTKSVSGNTPVTFIYTVSDKTTIATSKPIGSTYARVTNTIADSWSLVAKIGINALRIPNCNTVFLTGEGVQKVVKVEATGISLGATWLTISERDTAASGGGGSVGIGKTWGEAGRKGNPFIQASYLITQK